MLGPNRLKLYTYALVDFDYKSHICSVRLDGQGKNAPPLYTIRQCTPSDWVVLKASIPIALVSQQPGLMPKFTAWDLVLSPSVNQALVISFAVCIDWFRVVLKTETMMQTFE